MFLNDIFMCVCVFDIGETKIEQRTKVETKIKGLDFFPRITKKTTIHRVLTVCWHDNIHLVRKFDLFSCFSIHTILCDMLAIQLYEWKVYFYVCMYVGCNISQTVAHWQCLLREIASIQLIYSNVKYFPLFYPFFFSYILYHLCRFTILYVNWFWWFSGLHTLYLDNILPICSNSFAFKCILLLIVSHMLTVNSSIGENFRIYYVFFSMDSEPFYSCQQLELFMCYQVYWTHKWAIVLQILVILVWTRDGRGKSYWIRLLMIEYPHNEQ